MFNLATMLANNARIFSERSALIFGGKQLSFTQFFALAVNFADIARANGLRIGDRIGIALSRQEETLILAVGVWLMGATTVFLDFRISAEEKKRIARQIGMSAIVEERNFLPGSDYRSMKPDPAWFETGERLADFDIAQPGSGYMNITMTSGTTGSPVGVATTHETFLHRYLAHRTSSKGAVGGIYVSSLPLNYTAAQIHLVFHLLDGGTICFVPLLSGADTLIETIQSKRAKATFVVPNQLAKMLELATGAKSPIFPDMRAMTVAGSAVPGDQSRDAYRNLTSHFRIDYGSSICCPFITELYGDALTDHAESVGRLHPLSHVRLLDSQGSPVGVGEPGTIHISSPCVADAVLGEGADHSDKIVDGVAIPGDVGVLDADGFLYLVGRNSEMLIRGGVNIFPREVEGALERHPQIVESALFGFARSDGSEEVAIAIAGKDISPSLVRKILKDAVVPDKRPRFFLLLEQLPRNAAGKIEREKLSSSKLYLDQLVDVI